MAEWLAENWILMVLALGLGGMAVGWLVAAGRKTTIAREPGSSGLAEATARRNQALIDIPPAAATTPAPLAAPAAAEGDDLRRIKGVGPKLEALLHGLGVTGYAQIAGWTDADIERIDAQLGDFAGRIVRDDWRTQARLLKDGDLVAYDARFGKI